MLRSAFSVKSLERYFLLLAVAVLVPVSILTGMLLMHNWKAFSSAREAQRGFDIVRATLQAMERVSAERGPMNAAFGFDYPVPASALERVRIAREQSEAKIADLLALYRAPLYPDSAPEFNNVQRIRHLLLEAREMADRLFATPHAEVSGRVFLQAVEKMVAIIPELQASMAGGVARVLRNDTDAPSLLALSLLAAELREQAGLLGSMFTPALVKQRQLTQDDEYRIEHTLGRIDTLRALIAARIDTLPEPRPSAAYRRLLQGYFGEGLQYIAKVRDEAARQPAPVTTAELAARYVPMMRSITEFRDVMLADLQAHIEAQRRESLRLLTVTLLAAATLAAALLLSLGQFRRRVIRPFVQATRLIGAIADGGPVGEIPVGKYRGEVDGMFHALNVLKDNAATQRQLQRERDRLIEDLAHMAETDFLTGLLNRRAFETHFETLRSQWRGSPPVLAFILFDIDEFKRVNDTCGHAAGDQALRTVADLCRKTWRQSDVVARVGGEEFAALCLGESVAHVVEMAERMRSAIERAEVVADGGFRFRITASFGVACLRWHKGARSDTLFRHADEMLYQAKTGGRNRVLYQAWGESSDAAPAAQDLRGQTAGH